MAVAMVSHAARSAATLASFFADTAIGIFAADQAGRLVRVLEDWCPYYPGFFIYYPSRRQVPAALRAFVDFVKQPA